MGLLLKKKTLKKLYRSNQVKIQTGFHPGQVHVRKKVEGLKFKAEFLEAELQNSHCISKCAESKGKECRGFTVHVSHH